jgi:hypothetical protein
MVMLHHLQHPMRRPLLGDKVIDGEPEEDPEAAVDAQWDRAHADLADGEQRHVAQPAQPQVKVPDTTIASEESLGAEYKSLRVTPGHECRSPVGQEAQQVTGCCIVGRP